MISCPTLGEKTNVPVRFSMERMRSSKLNETINLIFRGYLDPNFFYTYLEDVHGIREVSETERLEDDARIAYWAAISSPPRALTVYELSASKDRRSFPLSKGFTYNR